MVKLKVSFLNSEGEKEASNVYDIKYENAGFETDVLFLVFTKTKGFHFQNAKVCIVHEDEKEEELPKKKK